MKANIIKILKMKLFPRIFSRQLSTTRSKITVSGTPNPTTFLFASSSLRIPRSVVSQIAQHGSVSDVHQINENSVAVTFFKSQAAIQSIREEVRDEMLDLIMQSSPSIVEIDIPSPLPRKVFDPNTAAGRVDQVIRDRILPGVNADGGDIELVELTNEGVAVVKLMGSCNGCPSSDATLKDAIQRTLLHFCSEEVKAVRQLLPDTPSIDSRDVLPAILSKEMDLPSVITHYHVGQEIESPLTGKDFPIVSLFAREVDEKLVSRVKFASTVHIPIDSTSGIDVSVTCGDCGAKKRLEDVDRLVNDAKKRVPEVDRVGIIICPACAVIVKQT